MVYVYNYLYISLIYFYLYQNLFIIIKLFIIKQFTAKSSVLYRRIVNVQKNMIIKLEELYREAI